MKILLLGDASNCQAILARALARQGHDVTLMSEGCRWMHTFRDIDISRRKGIIGGGILYTRMSTVLARDLRGYDIVQFSSPGFADLRPVWLRQLLRRIRRNNGRLFLSALGTDSVLVRNLTGENPALDYSEWQVGGHPAPWALDPRSQRDKWLSGTLSDYTEEFYSSMSGVASVLYEYHRIIEAEYPHLPVHYVGLPIDRSQLLPPKAHGFEDKIRILYACHRGRELEKGADILLDMARQAAADYGDSVEILTPGNMPYDSFTRYLAGADIVLDQLYSYTPAMTALLGMAQGVVAVSGAEDEYYNFIGQDTDLRPIFNPDPRDMEATCRRFHNLLSDRAQLRRMSVQGPEFIRRHNDSDIVARRYMELWEK